MRSTGRVAALLAVFATLAMTGTAGATGASGASELLTATADATYAGGASTTAITASPPACSDGKYNLFGEKWTTTLRWSFKASTTPGYLNATDVLTVLKRSFGNITKARNDCGRADNVSATNSYLGTTTRAIGVTKDARCGASDGYNTVGFGLLPSNVLAVTCVRSSGSRIVETDFRLNTQVSWALSLSGCAFDYMLEAAFTHEVGHAFGLAHVSESTHARLTMSTNIDGYCENQEALLGLGDLKGLEALY